MTDTPKCPGDELLMDAALASAGGATLSEEQRCTAAHASRCASCRDAMALWSGLARPISGPGPGGAPGCCLDDNALSEYLDGVMPWEDRAEAEAHLAACNPCLRQLSDLHTLMAASRPARTVPQLALGWLRDGLRLMGEAAEAFTAVPLAAVPVLDAPSGPKALAWNLESGAGPIRVTVQHDRGAMASLRLAFPEGTVLPGRCRVHLRSGGLLLESRTLGADGAVEFSELDVAGYDVEIEMAGDVVGFGFSLSGEA